MLSENTKKGYGMNFVDHIQTDKYSNKKGENKMTTKIIVTLIILSIVICQVGKAEKRKYLTSAYFDLYIMCIYLTTVIGIYLFLK